MYAGRKEPGVWQPAHTESCLQTGAPPTVSGPVADKYHLTVLEAAHHFGPESHMLPAAFEVSPGDFACVASPRIG
jgi:hypothetical protein